MREKDKIESRIHAILSVKRCKEGLSNHEEYMYKKFENKFRNSDGKLIKDAFYIDENGKWVENEKITN